MLIQKSKIDKGDEGLTVFIGPTGGKGPSVVEEKNGNPSNKGSTFCGWVILAEDP